MISKILLVSLAAFAAVQADSLTGRIVGGHEAKISGHPYQVSVRVAGKHVCGGSIINSRWVVTAAHCVVKDAVPDIAVKAGMHNISHKGQRVKVKNAIVHPDYQRRDKVGANDIALVELATELVFNVNVSAVQLPEDNVIPSGEGTLTGWGSISSLPIYPYRLVAVDLPIITYDECAEALIALNGTSEPLAESNVCTGPLEGGKGSCTGDSGGPLVAKGGNTLIGIDSWSIRSCGYKGSPSIFTRVSAFIGWINENIK